MKFEEALKSLVSGNYVQRVAWHASGEYVIALPGVPYIWKILPNSQPNPSAGNWLPTIVDLMADDYEVIKKCEREELPDAA